MSMFQVSALATRSRTTSLNIDSYGRSPRMLDDIIEEDNRYSSSAPGRPRAQTIELGTHRKRTMSEKSDLENFYNNNYNNQRRV